MDQTDCIIKQGVRILKPYEFSRLLNAVPSYRHKTLLKSLLFTGMRYEEIKRFKDNPRWLMEENFIHLPIGASLKRKCKQRERYVRLNSLGREVILNLLNNGFKIPTRQSLNESLKRWSIDSDIGETGITPKMFRKTWESWLVFSYPDRLLEILLSQGHTETVSFKHYLGLPFSDKDRLEMKEYVIGW